MSYNVKWKRLSRRDALQQLHFDEYNSLSRWQKYPIKFEYFESVGIMRHQHHRWDRAGKAYCRPDPKPDRNFSPY
jgi:hypothetical protein